MASAGKIKLFRLASEINIGKDTIVEFLQSKGYQIENKPTAMLTDQMIEAVNDKFKREIKALEKRREKIQKHHESRKVAEPKARRADDLPPHLAFVPELAKTAGWHEPTDGTTIADAKPYAQEQEQQILTKIQQKIDTPVAQKYDEISAKKAVKPADQAHEQIKPIESKEPAAGEKLPVIEDREKETGIDLPIDRKIAKDRESLDGQKPGRQEPPIAVSKAAVAVEEPIKTEQGKDIPATKVRKTADIEQPQPKPGFEEKEAREIAEPLRSQPIGKEAGKPGVAPEDLIQEATGEESVDKQPDDKRKPIEPGSKHRKKRKKLLEIEIQPGEALKLKGLTIVGKIDLDAEKQGKEKIKPKREKTLSDEEDEVGAKSKGQKKKRGGKVREKPSTRDKAEEKKKKKIRKSILEQISEVEVDKAIRETLAGIGEGHVTSQRAKMRQKKRAEREERETRQLEEREREAKTLRLSEYVTTNDMANLMNINVNEAILKCMQLGIMVSINQRLDKDTIVLIADDYGFEVEFIEEEAMQIVDKLEDKEEDLSPRPPIVTVMGHVDHGKTSLLDFIRKTNVVSGEAGGITQHIAAYKVDHLSGKSITFLDTPGHEAFTAMRARGAQVTDIVVLVVAADDSVMPQTIEAISHAKAANVKIIVAINKIDKPDARPDRIKQQLTDYQILVEDWGGRYQAVEISAKTGQNIDFLLEKILLEAEMLDMKANPDRNANGVVIEANMKQGLGTVATVIVQNGTLSIGDPFIAGIYSGKVRAMFDERGSKVYTATPSMPVLVIGFDGLPQAGDRLTVAESDTEARSISAQRKQLKREQEFKQIRHATLDEISRQIQIGGVKDLHLIIKGDVSGSVEAISDSLLKLSREEVKVSILHKGVGPINESDVMLAVASSAVIVGFNVSTTQQARKIADNESVDIRNYNIIYDCINEIQLALEGLLSPEIKEDILASVEIRKVFRISKTGNIAGCYVLNGKITRSDKIRVLRDGLPIFSGSISSLKRGKDDVKEVEQGYECGVQLNNFDDIRIGDIVEAYKLIEVKRTLS